MGVSGGSEPKAKRSAVQDGANGGFHVADRLLCGKPIVERPAYCAGHSAKDAVPNGPIDFEDRVGNDVRDLLKVGVGLQFLP